jgi:hypothetical protein
MTITFQAALQGAGCIRFDGDGEGIVKFCIPASELAEVAKLLTCRERLIRITVDTEGY